MTKTVKDKRTKKDKCTCFYCGREYVTTKFYNSNSNFYSNIGRIPYCKQCIENFYKSYFEKYKSEGCLTPEKKAVKRLCMIFDIYYIDDVFISSMNRIKENNINISPMMQYMKTIQLSQYNRYKETYENTITQEELEMENFNSQEYIDSLNDVSQKIIDFWGNGFAEEDYKYLQKEYEDWTTRHECNTKAQEELFKRLCFKQLEILKATRREEDTRNLDATFQNLLETAKLQPKQNAGDAMSDAQTFGTLIDKWETTRPIPEVDEELRDVDKIGLLVHTFFTGHIAKVLNLPSSLTALYDKFMEKYTVKKKEYSGESDNEVLFNNIFGKKNIDEQDI